jgi:hypothetical protein
MAEADSKEQAIAACLKLLQGDQDEQKFVRCLKFNRFLFD